MVEKLNNLIKKVEGEKGEISLFMLWKNLPEDDTWSVIISANWIEQMGQDKALQYWIKEIRNSLPKKDLAQINRVGFLKPHDRITNLITSAIRVDAPVTFNKNQIGELYIEEAIIFRARKSLQKKSINARDRNPIYNHSINPIYNHTINPIYNHSINPIYNHTINPIYNPGFSGYYFYDKKLKQNGYIIHASDEVILLFNFDNNLQATGTKNSIDGFTLFDTNKNWLGTMIPDGQNGFIFYSKDNKQIGIVK